jgi:hypothetical protein
LNEFVYFIAIHYAQRSYASPVGKRLLATLPKITKESMAIGMEWGKRVGAQIEREAEAEMKKKREVEKQG